MAEPIELKFKTVDQVVIDLLVVDLEIADNWDFDPDTIYGIIEPLGIALDLLGVPEDTTTGHLSYFNEYEKWPPGVFDRSVFYESWTAWKDNVEDYVEWVKAMLKEMGIDGNRASAAQVQEKDTGAADR